jgi:2'-5' RNA ligase
VSGAVQSLELLLDDGTSAAVREQWDRLAAAGLPSQARHAGDSNAPHVTVAVRTGALPGDLDAEIARAAGPLPLALVVGGLLVFARRRCVLARAVVPSAELLGLHAGVHDVLEARVATTGPSAAFLDPGAWTPHVTLARGLSADQVGVAVGLLSPVADLAANAVALRRWDAGARRTWVVAG